MIRDLSCQWQWPLAGLVPALPDDINSFGAVRQFDVHTGVDLHAPVGWPVVSVEPGEVVAIDPKFTGGPDSPWWNQTCAVLVRGASGVVLYGEVDPTVQVGDRVEAGTLVGGVLQVLRERPGKPFKCPPSMLHLELHEDWVREGPWWKLGGERPAGLRDPTPFLAAASVPVPRDRVVLGVIQDERGYLLLLDRQDGFDLPGGTLAPGEALRPGTLRLLSEHLELEAGFGKYLGILAVESREVHALRVSCKAPPQLRPGKYRDLKWVNPQDAAGVCQGVERILGNLR